MKSLVKASIGTLTKNVLSKKSQHERVPRTKYHSDHLPMIAALLLVGTKKKFEQAINYQNDHENKKGLFVIVGMHVLSSVQSTEYADEHLL